MSNSTTPPFQPWTIRRNDHGLFDLYGGSDHLGRPWNRPHILARDLDPTLAAWLSDGINIAEPSFTEAIRIWRSEKGLDNEGGPLRQKAETLLLAAGPAASPEVITEAFHAVFDLVQEARRTGDVTDCNDMLGWTTVNAYALHLEALIPCARLTCNMREHLDKWPPLLETTRAVIVERGEDADILLVGLTEITL